jgi:hypothetical protein
MKCTCVLGATIKAATPTPTTTRIADSQSARLAGIESTVVLMPVDDFSQDSVFDVMCVSACSEPNRLELDSYPSPVMLSSRGLRNMMLVRARVKSLNSYRFRAHPQAKSQELSHPPLTLSTGSSHLKEISIRLSLSHVRRSAS